MAWAPLGPKPWCLMFISSFVICSITKETGMIPSWEQASRYALRPENWSKISTVTYWLSYVFRVGPCFPRVYQAMEARETMGNRREAWELLEVLPIAI